MSLLLIVLGVLPTVFLIGYIYYKDSYEKEPVGLLVSLFLLGIVSIIPAVIFESVGELLLDALFPKNSLIYHFINAFFIVALAEEGGKYFFTYIRTWNCKQFDFRFDGIVYCVLTSLGFATLENILYIFSAKTGGLSTAITRALLSVPSHAIDAIIMGYFYGMAKAAHAQCNYRLRRKNLILALIVPILAHGFYDFCLFVSSNISILMFICFVIGIDIYAFRRIHMSSRDNQRIVYVNPAMYQYYNGYYYGYVTNPNPMPMNNSINNGMNNNVTTNNNYSFQSYGSNVTNSTTENTTTTSFNPFDIKPIYCQKCRNLCVDTAIYCPVCGKKIVK